ncbi:hypothetical protein CH289_07935 [Rhodococcus sp. RS1C4]|nr:hypothetical protein [Rhodococcus sp. RS1C4]OZC54859.1 hypothetical protein CH289_07935 [Rhodococcus sp. RS1C4]
MTTPLQQRIAQPLTHLDWAILCEIGHTCDHHRPPCPNTAEWTVTGHDCRQPDNHDGYIDRYLCTPHIQVIWGYMRLAYLPCTHCGVVLTPARWYIRIQHL